MSGEHKLAINASIDHCSDTCDQTDGDTIKRTCCDYDSFYFKEEIPTTVAETKTNQLASAFTFIAVYTVYPDYNSAESSTVHFFDAPDILPSVARHVLLETFLI
ncbi:hypothetical protein ACFLR1_02005 [Bacteroidota bacterium]